MKRHNGVYAWQLARYVLEPQTKNDSITAYTGTLFFHFFTSTFNCRTPAGYHTNYILILHQDLDQEL